MVVAALIIVPVAVVIVQAFAPGTDTWAHLAATVPPEYIRNTLWLLVGVALGLGIIGTLSAWLVTTYRFRGSRILEWALMLPLAMPAYVVAYAYTDALQFSGPVQVWLREMTGWRAREYWFPEIRSLGGAVALFILTLYPYVYLVARAAFLAQTVATLEASRLLGATPSVSFVRVALPLARSAIAAGIALAMMETLSDSAPSRTSACRHLDGHLPRVVFARRRSRRRATGVAHAGVRAGYRRRRTHAAGTRATA